MCWARRTKVEDGLKRDFFSFSELNKKKNEVIEASGFEVICSLILKGKINFQIYSTKMHSDVNTYAHIHTYNKGDRQRIGYRDVEIWWKRGKWRAF